MDNSNIKRLLSSNYSIDDLLEILNITEPSKENIMRQTSFYINKYANSNTELADFFQKAQKKLLGIVDEEDSLANKQGEEWRKNQYLPQENTIQNEKITERPQQVNIFDDNNHIFMKRKQLGINQSYEVPVMNGSLNPNLKNTFTRIINIDSQYRQNNVPSLKGILYNSIPLPVSSSTWSSTDFSLDLSDPLTNVLSLKLYSLQIPYTWYNIDKGINCFIVECGDASNKIEVDPGNYTPETLALEIQDKIKNTNICGSGSGSGDKIEFGYDASRGKFTIKNTSSEEITIHFWKGVSEIMCGDCETIPKINNNIGWLMGFRNVSYQLPGSNNSNPIIAEAVPNLSGTKYIIIIVEDFNTNRINKGLVTIQDTEERLSLPNYYKPGNLNNNSVERPDCDIPNPNAEPTDAGIPSKNTYTKVPTFTQGNPKIITQKQQYSLNEIIKNRKNVTSEKITAPSTTNVFAVVPIKAVDRNFGDIITEFSGPLPLNIRNYFGPVDIERMKITLLDDKGNVLNLNGADWSFTMISEHLYQY